MPQVRFYPFACKVVSVMPRAKHNVGAKFAAREYIFVGYSTNHKGSYLLVNPDTNKIVR